MKKINYSTLSAYTIAKNCSDLSDIEAGLNELRSFIKINFESSCTLAYKRMNSLEKKKLKLK